jgi:uncharacterized protein (TIGR03492 family)
VSGVLFVTNGHGETAIAQRLALELRAIRPDARCDHLALVGTRSGEPMVDVGPRKSMPSGGLIAMGNVRNLARDVGAGLLGLTWAQTRFLRAARGTYDAAVAVGDAYALAMTLLARTPTVFVGSAKSVDVAPYGRFEERVLARASACFVRDEATAAMLRRHGVRAEAANAIVDLVTAHDDPDAEGAVAGFETVLALFPGSRESAYDDGAFLLAITRELAAARRGIGAVLSIAPGLDARRFAGDARANGWSVAWAPHPSIPFSLGSMAARSCAPGTARSDRFSRMRRWYWVKPVRPTKPPPRSACRSWRSSASAIDKRNGTGAASADFCATHWPSCRGGCPRRFPRCARS